MDIFLHYILPPLVGAVIGYVTNWIAVKMLFRPLYPKFIGKMRIPFTPGIIPRRKDALAGAIGKAVGEELLTKEDIRKAFCDEEKRSAAVARLTDKIMELSEKDIRSATENFVSEAEFRKKLDGLSEALTERAVLALPQLRVGETVASVAGDAVTEKLKSSPLGMFVRADTVRSVAGGMAEKIDEYLSEHGREKLLPVVKEEIAKLSQTPVGTILENTGITRPAVERVVTEIYDKTLFPAISAAVADFDVASEVKKKIGEMDVKELEKLCLSVMKKELNAITWLGGLIGLLLGVVNIFL